MSITSPGSPRMLCCRTLKTVQYVDASVSVKAGLHLLTLRSNHASLDKVVVFMWLFKVVMKFRTFEEDHLMEVLKTP